MSEEDIIRNWKSGLTAIQIAKSYMKGHNEKAKRKNEPKIKIMEALAKVEPVIFNYETREWRNVKNIR